MNELTNLYDHHYRTWKLDGLYTPGENFVAIARLFAEAKADLKRELGQKIKQLMQQLKLKNYIQQVVA